MFKKSFFSLKQSHQLAIAISLAALIQSLPALAQQTQTDAALPQTTMGAPLMLRNTMTLQGNPPAEPAAQVRKAAPAPAETEFQRFVKRNTGQSLTPFGAQLFSDGDSGFATFNDSTPVTADYVVGVGDEVIIRAWGAIDIDYKVAIDRNGQISLPKVGTIQLSGVRASSLEDVVKQNIGRLYKNFSLNVTLGKLRPLRVYVVGQAVQPKLYAMPAMSTLLSTIFASGGPSNAGSMRTITLQRGGKAMVTFDVYDFLLKGDRSKDAALLDGDMVIFNPVGPRIAVVGAVDRPYIYELKASENSLADLFAYVGGLNVTTSSLNATIERITPTLNAARSMYQVQLDAQSQKTTTLQDGDVLTLMPVRDEFQNVVTLRGNVAMPLRYPFKTNMRVRDLIPDRQALITPDYYQRKNILVQTVATRQAVDVKTEGNFMTAAAVKGQTSAAAVLADSMNLADNINWDYAVIERLQTDLTVQLIPFNLGKAVLGDDATQNIELQAGDVVSVFSNRDLRMAQSKLSRTIRLEGEFSAGGIYQAQPNETLRQLVQRVGGLSKNAYVYGAVFTRSSVRVSQQKSMDEALERLERDLNLQNLARAANTSETVALAQTQQAAQQFVSRLKSVKATGRLVIEVNETGGLADLPNIEIEDGDVLYIPSQQATVAVLGAVHSEQTVIYSPGRTLKQYIEQAGGATPTADTENVYVLRANGTLTRKTNGWLGWMGTDAKLRPGDAVVIPEDIRRFETVSNYRNWAQVFSQFALGVASLKVLGIY
jgi:protein involved in polysaccharide export with SLBB domain